MEEVKSCENCLFITECRPCTEINKFGSCENCTFDGKPCEACERYQPDYQTLESQLQQEKEQNDEFILYAKKYLEEGV